MEGPLKIADRWLPALDLLRDQRIEEATALLRDAAEAGDADAQLLMGLRASYGDDDDAAARAWFERAAALGHPDAMYQLARGDRDLLIRAAEAGSPSAQRALGVYYSTGEEGFPLDAAQGAAWYLRAADQGSVSSMYDYGLGLCVGEGGVTDVPAGLAWLARAAEADPSGPAGDVEGEWAAEVLADAYERGLFGLTPDPELAKRWRARHAELETWWRVYLGKGQLEMALDELDGPRDLASVRAAAEQGAPKALRVMAILHERGLEGFPYDLEAARAWYRRSAEAGDVRSMYELGRLLVYANADPIEGVAWLERAANADPPDGFASGAAAMDLHQLHLHGTWGVPKDEEKAAFWEARSRGR